MIPALTLIRPMSAAIVHGSKRIENRPRDLPKKMRGVRTIVAVHAGKKFDDDYLDAIVRIDGQLPGIGQRGAMPSYECHLSDQGLVGLMLLSGTVFTPENPPVINSGMGEYIDPWFFGPYGYEILDAVPFEHDIACPGALGFWRVPDHLETVIRAMDGWQRLEEKRAA